jgi:hypothetical protein
MTNKQQFLDSYKTVLTRAWSDDAFMKQLQADPKATLADNGISTGSDEQVEIMNSPAAEKISADKVMEHWDTSTSKHKLYLPQKPAAADRELSESELSGVAGGTSFAVGGGGFGLSFDF